MADEIDLIKDLKEGFSLQAKASNNYWILLIIACIVSIANYNNNEEQIDLPFDLGKVDNTSFHLYILLIICALSIAFASAWIQQLRTRKLIQRVIDRMSNRKIHGIDIQDIFDSTSAQTFNRIAPIAQILQGKYQFYGDNQPPLMIRWVTGAIYFLFKLVTTMVIFIIPAITLYKNVLYVKDKIGVGDIPVFFYWIMIFASFSALLILIILDLLYLAQTTYRIVRPPKS